MATHIVVSAQRPAPYFTPLFVAIDKGFLAEQGLEATIQYRGGMEGLLRGEVDFLSSGAGYRAVLNGADVKMVCGHSTRESSHVLMMRPEIESAAQLEHVLLPGGSDVQGGRFVRELTSILALHGVDLDQSGMAMDGLDGSHPEQWKLLQQGIGDAATLGAPWWFFAAKAGYRNLGCEGDYSPGLSGAGIYVNPQKIANDPEVVKAFVRAYVKSMRYCLDNMEGTLETIMKYSREWGVDSDEIARAAYDEVAPYWKVEVEVATIDRLMRRESEKSGKPPIAAEKFLDLRFLDEALAG